MSTYDKDEYVRYWDEGISEAHWDAVARELAQQIREQALVTLGAKLKKLQHEKPK